MAVTGKKIVKYSVLPGILPRVSSFFRSGFSFFAGLIAVIYSNVGLLPPNHAYLNPNNFGKYGIRHVVAQAGSNLVFSRNNIDQIIIYFTILIGLALLALQIVFMGASIITSPVMASTWYNMFVVTPAGHTSSQDIAFVVLDNVFGIMSLSGTGSALGFFNSCISDLGTDCTNITGAVTSSPTVYPMPMHLALHQMLHFYTMGIAFVAGLVIIYFVVAIVGETVTSGTPFGRRFNKAWFIPRLIMFFALLAPISITGNNAGINVAQLIVFSVSKFGSNMATNAWLQFNDDATAATSTFLGHSQTMLSFPNIPEVGGLTQFMHVVRMCMFAEKAINGIDVVPYVVRDHNGSTDNVVMHDGTTETWATMGGRTEDYWSIYEPIYFADVVKFSRYNDVVVRFGHHNPPGGSVNDLNDPPDAYDNEWGYVEPTCGEIQFEITSLDQFVIGGVSNDGLQEVYFILMADYIRSDATNLMFDTTALCMIQASLPYDVQNDCVDTAYSDTAGNFDFTSDTKWITSESARAAIERFNAALKLALAGETVDWGTYSVANTGIISEMRAALDDPAYNNSLIMPPELRERGWAGAAIWYNKIAEINGIMAAAVQNLPKPFKYPKVMEQVAHQHKINDSNLSYTDRFNPRLQDGQLARLPRPGDQIIAAVLYNDFSFWHEQGIQETVHTKPTKNAIIDYINMIFGTQGLIDIIENRGVHPLAMLSSTGKGMVDASIRNLFAGVVGQGVGDLLGDNFFGITAKAASGFIVQLSLITLSIGFMLYYVLPLMPFIYFFFAFGGWIKSIFEAVVAMPIWALAHIKIDGNGLPGPLATNGYFLLFEIFLRPTLIIFGLLASISLFSALVNVLHDVFHILTLSASGYDMEAEVFASPILAGGAGSAMQFWQSPIDELFYTIIYTIIVYMLGLSSFKLIDQVPNNIMRWMGVTVTTFKETEGDPAGEMVSKMYRVSQMTNAQITQMIARMKGQDSSSVSDQLHLGG